MLTTSFLPPLRPLFPTPRALSSFVQCHNKGQWSFLVNPGIVRAPLKGCRGWHRATTDRLVEGGCWQLPPVTPLTSDRAIRNSLHVGLSNYSVCNSWWPLTASFTTASLASLMAGDLLAVTAGRNVYHRFDLTGITNEMLCKRPGLTKSITRICYWEMIFTTNIFLSFCIAFFGFPSVLLFFRLSFLLSDVRLVNNSTSDFVKLS